MGRERGRSGVWREGDSVCVLLAANPTHVFPTHVFPGKNVV